MPNTMTKPKMFIGSSKEGLLIAEALHRHLEGVTEPTIWNQNIFQLGDNVLDRLLQVSQDFDFAVLVFSRDDLLKLRDHNFQAARDNVVFELGIFMGSKGKDKTYYVIPEDMADFRVPSDLAGVIAGTYQTRDDDNWFSALTTAAGQIKDRINKQPTKCRFYNTL
jgi:predicted nucleotide-binding protein